MAKEKAAKVAEIETPEDFTTRVAAEVKSEYGDDIIISGQDAMDRPPMVIPISPAMDIITCGGLEEGSTVGITGNEKTGKTSMALAMAANAQRPEYGSRPVYYVKAEGRLSLTHLRGVKGLDLSPGRFNIIKSRKGKILTQQDFLRIMDNILRTVPGAFMIIDSISAFVDEREATGGVGTELRGGGAKGFSQWMRLMNQVIPTNDSIVVGITHLICDTGNAMAGKQERAARMWKYQCDYQLRTIVANDWKAGEEVIGIKTNWLCKAGKRGGRGMKIDSYIRFGTGVDRLYEAVSLGCKVGLIKQAGSWLTLSYMKNYVEAGTWDEKTEKTFKTQGGEKLYQMLLDNPQWAQYLEQEIQKVAGGLVSWGGE